MIKIPSKYSISTYTPFGTWLLQRTVSMWNAAPDMFVKPYVSDIRFGFVLGCGHSGTTLTVAKLGSHSNTFLIGRETNAFGPVVSAHCSRRIVREWSYFAELEHKGMVLEKTPKHVHSIGKIKRVLPGAKFICTVRNPLDNIASLYARFGSLDGAVRRWKVDNRKIQSLQGENFVKVVRYEDITRDPGSCLRELCGFLGLPWEEEMVEKVGAAFRSVRLEGNMTIRADQVSEPIKPRINTWEEILTESQARSTLDRTKGIAVELGYNFRDNMALVL